MTTTDPPPQSQADDDIESIEELRTQFEILADENDRLRQAYAAAHRTQYRRTAIALLAVGGLAIIAGVLFPAARTVLLSLAGIAVFAGILTYYLTPERFVAASVGERLQHSTSDTYASIIDELGLQDTRVYVPGDDPVLFVPLHADYSIPDADAVDQRFVVTDNEAQRGLTIVPAGAALFEEFEPALSGGLHDEPGPLADQLGDGVVEMFELADRVEADVEPGRITYEVTTPALGPVSDVDHPVVSFLAVGTAIGVDEPITTEIDTSSDSPFVTCRWQSTAPPAANESE